MDKCVLIVSSRIELLEYYREQWLQYETLVQLALDMPSALEILVKNDYVLVVICAETIEFLPLLKLMRELKPMPILIISTNYNADEKIEAIHRGADEYVAYSKNTNEWLASAWALIRRYTVLNNCTLQTEKTIIYRELTMLVDYRKVFVSDQEVPLTKSDFELLYLLLKNPGRVFTFEQIYAYLYGDDEDMLEGSVANAVRCQIKRIRKKMRIVSPELDYIISVRNLGYCIHKEFQRREVAG